MSEHRSSASEGIWIGLCLLLLVLLAVLGAFSYIQHRQKAAFADRVRLMNDDMLAERNLRHEQMGRAVDLSHEVHELQQRVGELENENNELRQQLKKSGE